MSEPREAVGMRIAAGQRPEQRREDQIEPESLTESELDEPAMLMAASQTGADESGSSNLENFEPPKKGTQRRRWILVGSAIVAVAVAATVVVAVNHDKALDACAVISTYNLTATLGLDFAAGRQEVALKGDNECRWEAIGSTGYIEISTYTAGDWSFEKASLKRIFQAPYPGLVASGTDPVYFESPNPTGADEAIIAGAKIAPTFYWRRGTLRIAITAIVPSSSGNTGLDNLDAEAKIIGYLVRH